uniref:Uncharacterized protein n=1 Tax=Anguilla anguilla TaxID=7936 RepID=A0A0E9WT79_ANGAN
MISLFCSCCISQSPSSYRTTNHLLLTSHLFTFLIAKFGFYSSASRVTTI